MLSNDLMRTLEVINEGASHRPVREQRSPSSVAALASSKTFLLLWQCFRRWQRIAPYGDRPRF